VVLAGMVLGSMGLSMISLLIGAMARLRGTQVVTSVILILGLALACVGGIALGWTIIQSGSGFMREEEFWIAISVMLTFYITFFGLFHSAAAAQIAFVSENRSTPLRRWMMVQQACFCGWMAAGIYYELSSTSGNGANNIGEALVAATVFATGYWAVMGALLTGEWPILSRRVQRSLPQSTLGRTTLSLFNPGPGTGYLFAASNLTMLIAVGLILLVFRGPATGRFVTTESIACLLVLSWSYVVGYLGVGRLITVLLRRWIFVPLTAAFLVQILLVMVGSFTPLVIQMTSRQLRNQGYSLLQISNPFWTLYELVNRGSSSVQAEVLVWIVPAAAVAVLLLNMRSVATELMHHRVAPPVRVLEEEAALHVPVVKPSNPWEIEEDDH
jgi:hypothetical protein